MSLNAAALKLLADKGLSAADIVALAEALESGVPKSSGAVRQARYRENKKARAVTGDVTNDVTSDVTAPPIDNIIPPSSEANASGGEPPDLLKSMFDAGLALLTSTGTPEKQARSLLGKWKKAKGEAEVLVGLDECRSKRIEQPVEWLEKRFQAARYVSASGYEYRGNDIDIMREAERRGDNNTYWAVKASLSKKKEDKPAAPRNAGRTRRAAPIGDLLQRVAGAN